ncbi:MAG: hypothetical protein JWN14_3960, partial [Chthonomonadales bacterium]|nr:hypothetical protein [Chthonomonadales bacterium]
MVGQGDGRAVEMEGEGGACRNFDARFDVEQVTGCCQGQARSCVQEGIFPL